jgi:hypothetical protein|tara:strand:- start:71 stop:586 length:516 start_codon:yes stop_codon:yes gene_type:complete
MSEEKIVENTVDTDVKMEEGTKPELNAIPRSRLNEVIEERNTLRDEIKSYELKQEEVKKSKLVEEEKWQELNVQLQKEVESLTPFKEKYDSLDGKIRAEALNKLPEQKQEKFKNLNTTDLLNVVEELASKVNPPDNAGTVDRGKISKEAWKSMDINDKRKNWSSILDSYKR